MKINKALILSLQPCQNRLDNYLKFYENKQLTPAQFLGLKHITQEDKMWVIFRLMPKENIALATADIAESVLYIFESKHPNDNRPRKAIEAARGKDTDNAAFYAAAANASAAYATKAAAAAASADYSDYSAANAAYAAAAAFYAAAANAAYAAYAAKAAKAANANDSYTAFLASAASMYASFDAATDATNAAADAAFSDKLAQEKLNRKICLKYMKERK